MTAPRQRTRTKFRDMTMGVLLAIVMAGGLTALISHAERTARAEPPGPQDTTEQHCLFSDRGH